MSAEPTSGSASAEPASGSGPAMATAVTATVAGIVGLALIVLLVDPLNDAVGAALRGDTREVRESIRGLGVGGALIVLGLCLAHAVLWYPAEIVDAAAGFVYGFWPALGLVMAGWMLNAWAAYAIGHTIAHPVLNRILGRERFEGAERIVHRGGVSLLITVRLVPIFPFSIISYAAGAARVPLWRYTWTTAVGYLPITAISTYLGSRLEDIHLTDPLVIGSLAVLALLLLAVRWFPRALGDQLKT
jgi:uncharacterized membrane protein YdjX (TVP38/TMEM64 family)